MKLAVGCLTRVISFSVSSPAMVPSSVTFEDEMAYTGDGRRSSVDRKSASEESIWPASERSTEGSCFPSYFWLPKLWMLWMDRIDSISFSSSSPAMVPS